MEWGELSLRDVQYYQRAAEEDLPCVSCGRATSLCAQESVSSVLL